jgi:hypothetical protein
MGAQSLPVGRQRVHSGGAWRACQAALLLLSLPHSLLCPHTAPSVGTAPTGVRADTGPAGRAGRAGLPGSAGACLPAQAGLRLPRRLRGGDGQCEYVRGKVPALDDAEGCRQAHSPPQLRGSTLANARAVEMTSSSSSLCEGAAAAGKGGPSGEGGGRHAEAPGGRGRGEGGVHEREVSRGAPCGVAQEARFGVSVASALHVPSSVDSSALSPFQGSGCQAEEDTDLVLERDVARGVRVCARVYRTCMHAYVWYWCMP